MKVITVEDTFLITGRGLVIAGQKENDLVEIKVGGAVEILRTDGTAISSQIIGIDMINRRGFPTPVQNNKIGLLLKDLSKEDIPIGSIINCLT